MSFTHFRMSFIHFCLFYLFFMLFCNKCLREFILLDSIISKISSNYKIKNNLSELDEAKLKYSLSIILYDLTKIVILIITFLLINKFSNFIYAFIPLMLLRPFTGGIHFKTYLGCLFFSILFFLGAIYSNSTFSLDYTHLTIILLFSSVLTIALAPLPSKNRPVYSNRELFKFKIITGIILLLHILFFIFYPNNPYIIQYIWVLLFHSIQLSFTKGGLLYEKFYQRKK